MKERKKVFERETKVFAYTWLLPRGNDLDVGHLLLDDVRDLEHQGGGKAVQIHLLQEEGEPTLGQPTNRSLQQKKTTYL